MANKNTTIANASDSRLGNSGYVYTGNSVEEDVYVGSSSLMLELREQGLLPSGFDIRDFKTEDDLRNAVSSLSLSPKVETLIFNEFYIGGVNVGRLDNPVSNYQDYGDTTLGGFRLDSSGKTPVESAVLVYEPKNALIPSIRSTGEGIISDGTNMASSNINDPTDGLSIPQATRSMNRPDLIPMFFDMVDSTLARKGIYIGNEFIVTTLKMSPNPDTMTVNSSKKINRYNTMTRWVEEHWGDEIDTVSMTGATFSFFGYQNQNNSRGLTSAYRDETQSYKFMRELIKFFRTNGCIYQGGNDYDGPGYLAVTDLLSTSPHLVDNHPRKGMIKERLYVRLTYDYLRLIGRFDSFDIIEDSTTPFKFQYSAVFKAEKTEYLLDTVPGSGATKPLKPSQTTALPVPSTPSNSTGLDSVTSSDIGFITVFQSPEDARALRIEEKLAAEGNVTVRSVS